MFWKKAGWILLWLIPLIIFNAASIFWLVSQMIEFKDVSLWNVLTIKFLAKELEFDNYHWYNAFLTYLFMGFGFALTYGYIKFTINQKIITRRQKQQTDTLTATIEKIYKK